MFSGKHYYKAICWSSGERDFICSSAVLPCWSIGRRKKKKCRILFSEKSRKYECKITSLSCVIAATSLTGQQIKYKLFCFGRVLEMFLEAVQSPFRMLWMWCFWADKLLKAFRMKRPKSALQKNSSSPASFLLENMRISVLSYVQ